MGCCRQDEVWNGERMETQSLLSEYNCHFGITPLWVNWQNTQRLQVYINYWHPLSCCFAGFESCQFLNEGVLPNFRIKLHNRLFLCAPISPSLSCSVIFTVKDPLVLIILQAQQIHTEEEKCAEYVPPDKLNTIVLKLWSCGEISKSNFLNFDMVP